MIVKRQSYKNFGVILKMSAIIITGQGIKQQIPKLMALSVV